MERKLGERWTREGRYWNVGMGICIMAAITEGVDWAAYIGADNGESERNCMEYTLEYGAKLLKHEALCFFPEFKDRIYRR